MNWNCSLPGCIKTVKCRCSVCKTWYCSQACQEDHWPRHSKACARVPDLEWPLAPVTRRRSDSDSGVASATRYRDRGNQIDPGISEARGETQKPHQIKPDQLYPNNSETPNEAQNVQSRGFKMNSSESVNSINDFYIRLQHENERCLKLMKSLNHKNHCGDRIWKGDMKDPVAVLVEDVWYRGSCLEQSSNDEFKIMLMDFGWSVIVSRMMIKPLHPRFSEVPFFCHRVCLAGIEPSGTEFGRNEILFFSHLLTIDHELQFYVEFVGGEKEGRRLVKLRDEDGNNDITELLLESGVGVRPYQVGKLGEIGRLNKEDDGIQVTVSHMRTPSHLFLLPERNTKILQSVTTQISQFMRDHTGTAGESLLEGGLGLVCVEKDACWYRAEVIKLRKDGRLSLFLIDQGGFFSEYPHKVKSMSRDLQEIPGLALEVQLRGIKPGTGTNWIREEFEYCEALLDVGRKTSFLVRNIKNHEQKTFVDLEDPEGNDVASMMVEIGCAAADKLSGFEFKKNVLTTGSQKVLVLAVVSTRELFLCSPAQFEEFSAQVVPASFKAAAEADLVITARPGDLVLANRDDVWCRARIIHLVEQDQDALVKLLDLAITCTIRKDHLRMISPEVCAFPILAVRCSLQPSNRENGFELHDDKARLSKFVEYEEVNLTVTEDVHGNTLVQL